MNLSHSWLVVLGITGLLATVQVQGQTPSTGKQSRAAKKATAKPERAAQPLSPIQVDVANWPPDETVTVQIELGRNDREPTVWDGKLQAAGVRVRRLRGWRFGAGMAVDAERLSWQCGTWLGPTPLDRVFDRHLPDMPQPFVRPSLLVDVDRAEAAAGELRLETSQGPFTIDLAALANGRGHAALGGRVWVQRAVFGYPVATRTHADQHTWYDDPALAVASGSSGEEVAVSYLVYAQDTTSDAIYVRRRAQGTWQPPEQVSEARGDHYRSAVSYDASGALWVSFAAQVEGNWDLYARRRTSEGWESAIRLTTHAQPDMQHVMVADRAGGVWVVWQGFRDGQSDILARRWTGRRWEGEQRISESSANDWHPAAAPLAGGGIAVAWDTYEQGDYDIRCRTCQPDGTAWGPVVSVTRAETMEARPSIAADLSGRLWIAYDTAGPYWGKDTGFMLELARAPQGTRLYEGRGVAVSVVEAGTNRVQVPAQSEVRFDSFQRSLHEQPEYPQLVADPRGGLWLIMRRRAMLSISRRGVGRMFGWDVLISRFDPHTQRWSEPSIAADSLGRLDSPSGVAAGLDALWFAWSNDHRTYATNRPDRSSIFAGTLPLPAGSTADVSGVPLSDPPKPGVTSPPAHPREADDVARLRQHVLRVGSKTYRIYRGDMHRHTETSSDGGGDGSMLDVYRYALDAAAMDFLLVTDHHDGGREYDWWRREKFNDLFRVGDAFVGLFGYERSLSYPNGHRNVFFTSRGHRPLANLPQENGRDPVGSGTFLYPHLRERGGICFSHTSATGMGTDWRDNDPELEPLVEIFQGDRTNYEKLDAPWSATAGAPGTQEGGFEPLGYVNLALAKGYKLGFQASSDHLSTHLSYSCILAERNTREALMEAMKQRHAYAATDNILLDVRSSGQDGEHIMGDIFPSTGPPRLRVHAVGTGPLAEVVVVKDDRVVYSLQPPGNEVRFEFVDMEARPGTESYYYVRVVQADRQIAWASPMWITRNASSN